MHLAGVDLFVLSAAFVAVVSWFPGSCVLAPADNHLGPGLERMDTQENVLMQGERAGNSGIAVVAFSEVVPYIQDSCFGSTTF